MNPAPPSSVPPKILESVGRHFGVSDGVLNILVPEVVLQGPGRAFGRSPSAGRSRVG